MAYRLPLVRVAIVRDGSFPLPAGCSRDVARIAHEVIGDSDRETVLAIGISRTGRAVAVHEVAVGAHDSVPLCLATLLRAVLLMGCPSFALAHNHPGGDARPSPQDDAVTKRVAEGAKAVGLTLLDHVIVAIMDSGARDSYSYCDSGCMPDQ